MNKSCMHLLVALVLFSAGTASAEPAWVTDEFEITLRSGPSTNNAIQLMVSSGTRLEVLEQDAETGYSRVQTLAGTEGWVLTRYLVNEAGAREQLQALTGDLTDATSEGASLSTQLSSIRSEYDAANARIVVLEREKQSVESELAEIKRTAANVLGVNEQNQKLMDELATSQIRVDTLDEENRRLASQSTRYWFLSGGLLLLVGIILGIWLPRIRWQKRSRYDRF